MTPWRSAILLQTKEKICVSRLAGQQSAFDVLQNRFVGFRINGAVLDLKELENTQKKIEQLDTRQS